MASVINRAQWEVRPTRKADAALGRKCRSKKAADDLVAELEAKGIPAKASQPATGFWEATVRMKDGKGEKQTDRRTFDTQAEAEAWADEKEGKIEATRRKGTSAATSKKTLGDALDLWYAEAGKLRKGAKEIKYRLPQIKESLGADTPLADITVPVLRRWRDEMDAEGYAASSILNFKSLVSSLFRHAISEWDYEGENFTRLVKWPKADGAIPPPPLSQAKDPANPDAKSEQDILFAAIKKRSPWLLPVVKWALETAMRRGEILALMWEDVDMKRGVVHIRNEKNDHKKKQTEAKGRDIPLVPATRAILEALQPVPEARKGRVFQGSPSSLTHSFEECAKAAKRPDLTFHSLRKIGTSRLSKKLPNVVELSQITGHRDLATLAKAYYGKDLKDLAAKITAA